MPIRPEQPGEERAISALIDAAFAFAENRDGTEAAIVERLREAGALTLSLVAAEAGEIVGHVTFSPVTIDGESFGWFGLGPVAVAPERQRSGIGAALVQRGLELLREGGALGCVLVGEPRYYSRFGFIAEPRLRFPGPPAEYFQALAFAGEVPAGTAAFHRAFG